MGNTLSELRTRLTQQFAKGGVRVPGSAGQQDPAPRVSGGYTIVELLVAIVVGGILLTSMSTIISNYLHLNPMVRALVLANSYVEAKVEALRNVGFNTLADGTTDISAELPANLNAPRTGNLEISSPSSGLKKIEISLSYNDQGTTRTYAYTTYIGELGVGKP